MASVIFSPALLEGDFLDEYETYAAAGSHRLRSLAVYGPALNPHYATLWVPAASPPACDIAFGLRTKAELQAAVDFQKARSFLPTLISGTRGEHDGEFNVSVWFEHVPSYPDTDPHVVAFEDMDYLAGKKFLDEGSRAGFVAVSVDFAPKQVEYWHFGIFLPQTNPPMHVGLDLRRADLVGGGADQGVLAYGAPNDEYFKAMQRGWSHVEQAVPGGRKMAGGRQSLLSLWRADTVLAPWPDEMADETYTGGSITYGPFPPSNAPTVISWAKQSHGYTPIHVGANWNEIDGSSMCITFAKQRKPLARKLVIVDGLDPEAPARVPWSSPLVHSDVFGDLPMADPDDAQATSSTAPRRKIRRLGHSARRFQRNRPLFGDGPPDFPDDGVGGSGPLDPNQLKPVSVATFAEGIQRIDDILRTFLQERSGRALQLAVGVNGKLVLLRNYTWAEQNYPVLWSKHKMRLASISKALCAMAIAKLYAVGPDIDAKREGFMRTLDDVFEFTPSGWETPFPYSFDLRAETTLEHLLCHRSGWFDEYSHVGIINGQQYAAGPWFEAATRVAAGHSVALPGDTREFIAHWPSPFYDAPPGSYEDYHGITYRALGELVGRKLRGQWWQHVDAMYDFWELSNPDSLAGLVIKDRAESLLREQFPAHDPTPYAVAWPEFGNPFEPYAYHGNVEWGGAAGAWVMSMATLSRILNGMGQSSHAPQLLSPQQTLLLAEEPYNDGWGRGWKSSLKTEKWEEPNPWFGYGDDEPELLLKTRPWRAIFHNGSGAGASSVAAFFFAPDFGSARSVSICATMNLGGYGANIQAKVVGDLFELVCAITRGPGWPNTDYFDEG